MSNTLTTPSEDEIVVALRKLRVEEPGLGRPKVLAKLKENNDWSLSDARLKKIMATHNLESIPLSSKDSTSEHNQAHVPPMNGRAESFDLTKALTALYNAMESFPPFPKELLEYNYDEEVEDLPPPEIPANAFGAQVKYREESTRQLIIYGRGAYNFGITPNSIEGLYYNVIFLRREKNSRPFNPTTEADSKCLGDSGMLRILWEFYEAAAKKAGVSRADVGKQFEAEWGIDMHRYCPPRRSSIPEVQEAIRFWESKRAAYWKKNSYSILQTVTGGNIVWDDRKHKQFSVIVTKIDKKTGRECGDL